MTQRVRVNVPGMYYTTLVVLLFVCLGARSIDRPHARTLNNVFPTEVSAGVSETIWFFMSACLPGLIILDLTLPARIVLAYRSTLLC